MGRQQQHAESHPSPLCPSVTLHTRHISSTISTQTPRCHPWICGHNPPECGTAGQMHGEAGWWSTNGKIALFPLTKVKGVSRQHNVFVYPMTPPKGRGCRIKSMHNNCMTHPRCRKAVVRQKIREFNGTSTHSFRQLY